MLRKPLKALYPKMTHFKGAKGRVQKGEGRKGKKQPPPEIKALRETWSAVIEVRESSKPRKVLLNPGHVNTLFSPLTPPPKT